MGFKEVYMALQEIFPQIDSRVLRAVSIEHSKDVDAAIEVVLVEIIPLFTERSRQNCPSGGSMNGYKSSKGAIPTAGVGQATLLNTICSTADQNGSHYYDMNGGFQQSFHDDAKGHNDTHSGYQEGDGRIRGLKLSENCEEINTDISIDVFRQVESVTVIDQIGASHTPKLSANLKNEETVSAGKCPEKINNTVSNQSPGHTLRTLEDMDVGVNQNLNRVPALGNDSNVALHKENHEGKSSASGKLFEVDSFMEQSSFRDLNLSPTESSVQFVVAPDVEENDLEKLNECLETDATSKIEDTDEMVGFEDGTTLNASVSQSGQIHLDLLEDVIADARNNKKTLFSAMESVISMMKEVELKEKSAEQAKMEVANGGSDILDRVEELRQMMQRAKEANDMHAGEVYGEKAILATEFRELQSRVLSLSDERDKSLATLDEMRQTLEMRLAAAENVIESAEQEKLEKDNSVRKTLANQELVMEQVVQESKKLKQQAEENTKLREFLVDRGRVVDILQGEIAVIRQDVKLLKDKFDEHIPFSRSLSSSQTSFILASSSSSLKTLIADQIELVLDQIDSLESIKKRDPEPCFDEQMSEKETSRDDVKERIDDGWEIFDNRDFDM